MNLKKALLLGFAAMTASATCVGCRTAAADNPSKNDAIYAGLPFAMERVALPEIPAREVSVADFGGSGDGITLNTEAFAKAIAHLSERGGGRVSVPQGVWYTGPIELLDNIELHLEDNAIILFSDNKDDYPVREITFEGLNTWRCQSPISAMHVKNVAITGNGIIDGNGDAWRAVKRGKLAPDSWKKLIASGGVLSEKGDTWYPSECYRFGATSGADQNVSSWARTKEDFERMRDFLRPVLVAVHHCENVLLKDVVFQNSPCWNIHPAMCTNVTVDHITVRCPWYAQNGDGIDFESCKNVVMTDCSLDVGDDGICIKSGKDKAGRDRGIPCENIIVDDCIVFHGHGGFVVGSEMSGGVKNVMVSNCTFSGTDVGLRFKSTRGRGGVVENIRIENIAMNDIVQDALLFDLFYGGKSASEAVEEGTGEATDMVLRPVDETTPAFRNIHIRNVWCRGARRAMFFNGLPEMNVEHVTVENARIFARTGAEICESTDVLLRDVTVVPERGPALKLNNVKKFRAEEFSCPEGMECALQATGSRNRDILVSSKEITSANACLSAGAAGAVTIDE